VLGCPRRQHDDAAGPGNPAHFPGRCRAVREELQAVLAQHRVEAVVASGDRRRRAFQVLNRRPPRIRRPGGRQREHGGADVTGRHAATGPGRLSRQPRDRAQPARDVKHAMAPPDLRARDQFGSPWLEQLAQHEPVVALRNRNLRKAQAPRALIHHARPSAPND
jgi:hypothetical protein